MGQHCDGEIGCDSTVTVRSGGNSSGAAQAAPAGDEIAFGDVTHQETTITVRCKANQKEKLKELISKGTISEVVKQVDADQADFVKAGDEHSADPERAGSERYCLDSDG